MNGEGVAKEGGPLEDIIIKGESIISFVGMGGKTSLLRALAKALRSKGKKVITTTTTKVAIHEIKDDFMLVDHGDDGSMRMAIEKAHGNQSIPFVQARPDANGKVSGISPSNVLGLRAHSDIILVEADGGRGRPIKRLRSHEPPIPDGTASGLVCIVVGLDAIGRPLDGRSCFNFEGVVEQGLALEGDIITEMMARRIIYTPRGYLDVVPKGQGVILLVNKADGNGGLKRAIALARNLYHESLRQVIVTTTRSNRGSLAMGMEVTNRDDRVFGVVLAAGSSTRFGRNKLLEPYDDTTILGKVLEIALGCTELERVILVLGHEHERSRKGIGDLQDIERLDIIVNEDHEDGMASSLRAGVLMATVGGCDAVALMLGDMPGIDPGVLQRVMDGYRSSCCRICQPREHGRGGHPVIIRKEFFDSIRALQADVGAKQIIEDNIEWSRSVDLGPDWDLSQTDIDTLKDLEAYSQARKG